MATGGHRRRGRARLLGLLVSSAVALVWLGGMVRSDAQEDLPPDLEDPVFDADREVRPAIPITGDAGATPAEVPRAEPVSPSGVVAEPAPQPAPPPVGAREEEDTRVQLESSWETQPEARTILMSVPAPRGQITDRHGRPLAQNRIGYFLALRFPFFTKPDDAAILRFARQQTDRANRLLGTTWELPPDRLIEHYRHRRWLPLAFPSVLTQEQIDLLVPLVGDEQGLVLQPAYFRFYPRGSFAAHVLGYVGRTRPLPTGPITNGEPLWTETEGRSGLELTFDEDLQGQPGQINHLFGPDGRREDEYLVQPPRPGHNVVTTLDLDLQDFCEDALRKHSKRGAFVIMDIRTGDLLALASWPLFDPHTFVPSISQEDFTALQEDPDKPLFGRAFQGLYPPASTFKVTVALAALDSGVIDANDYFSCPSSLAIGDRVFRNWNKNGEGSMNVVDAITRSCNTWFYQVGRKTGANQFLSVARRLGLGEPTGIPISGEAGGNVPEGASHGGITANLSIGQGSLAATPLQVARMMAAIAHGESVMVPRLVKQVQDLNNTIVRSYPVEVRNQVSLSAASLKTVHKGMVNVVSGGNGTGRSAGIKYAQIAGKTGTGQWRPRGEDRRVAWFAGFLPADDPKYSFAALYEGDLGETVSGGGTAAPMIKEVFTRFYENEVADRLASESAGDEESPGEEPSEDDRSEEVEVAEADVRPARPAPQVSEEDRAAIEQIVNGTEPPAPEPAAEKPNLFRRLFGRFRGR